MKAAGLLGAGVLAGAMVLSGCAQTSAADGATEQVCRAMSGVQSSLESLGSATNAGQAQETFAQISDELNTAKSEASGLAQAIITNLSATMANASSAVSGLAPDAQLPEGFTGTVNSVTGSFDDVLGKLKCPTS